MVMNRINLPLISISNLLCRSSLRGFENAICIQAKHLARVAFTWQPMTTYSNLGVVPATY